MLSNFFGHLERALELFTFSTFSPLVLSFIDYEQAFDSVDRRALAKVLLSLYGIPEKYIKLIFLCTRIILLRLR